MLSGITSSGHWLLFFDVEVLATNLCVRARACARLCVRLFTFAVPLPGVCLSYLTLVFQVKSCCHHTYVTLKVQEKLIGCWVEQGRGCSTCKRCGITQINSIKCLPWFNTVLATHTQVDEVITHRYGASASNILTIRFLISWDQLGNYVWGRWMTPALYGASVLVSLCEATIFRPSEAARWPTPDHCSYSGQLPGVLSWEGHSHFVCVLPYGWHVLYVIGIWQVCAWVGSQGKLHWEIVKG